MNDDDADADTDTDDDTPEELEAFEAIWGTIETANEEPTQEGD